MTKFLAEDEILVAIGEVLERTETADLAVAYWGRGAATEIGLDQSRAKVRVVCDLFSGACCPDEIKRLIGRLNTEVRCLAGLHAKVWLTPSQIIVGSANASANGLGFMGRELRGNQEACILTDDTYIINKSQQWFERIWSMSAIVDEKDLEIARLRWNERRSQRFSSMIINNNINDTLLHRVLNGFPFPKPRSLKISLAEQERVSGNALNRFDYIREKYYPHLGNQKIEDKDLPFIEEITDEIFLEDGALTRYGKKYVGSTVILFNYEESSGAKYMGMWKIKPREEWQELEGGTCLVLCDRVTVYEGVPFTDEEAIKLKFLLDDGIKNKFYGKNNYSAPWRDDKDILVSIVDMARTLGWSHNQLE